MASDVLKEHLKRGNTKYRVKWYIQDDSEAWVDFTARAEFGNNRLQDIGNVEISGEKNWGQSSTHDITITADNSDRFWNRAPSRISGLLNIDGGAASFSDFYGKKSKLEIEYLLDGGAVEVQTVGTYYVDGVSLGNSTNATAQVTLTGLQKKLREVQAVTVKNGRIPYRQRPIAYIIRRILEKVHTAAEIATFDLPDNIEIKNYSLAYSAASDYRSLSFSSRMPHQDSNGAWLNSEQNKSTVLSILQNDNIDSNLIYMGVDNVIWSYNISGDYCTQHTAAADIGADYIIRRMYYRTDGRIWGFATNYPDSQIGCTGKIFIFNPTTTTVSIIKTLTNMFSGIAFSRETGNGPDAHIVGQGTWFAADQDGGENLVLPFAQQIQVWGDATVWNGAYYKNATSILDRVALGDNTKNVPGTADLAAGYNAIWGELSVGTADFLIRFSYGQRGVMHYDSSADLIFYCKVNSSINPTSYTIYKYVPSTGVETALKTLTNRQPCCIASDGTNIFVGSVQWQNTAQTLSIARIEKINFTTTTLTELYNSSADTASKYYTPMDLVVSGSDLVVSIYVRSTNTYALGTISTSVVTASIANTINTTQYAHRLFLDNSNNVTCVLNGALSRWTKTAALPTKIDDFNRIGNVDTLAYSNIIERYDTVNSEYQFFGISGTTFDNDFHTTFKAGEYWLWKYSKFIFPYRPLYDFNDLDGWQVIEKFAQYTDYITNYDRAGLFYFRQRPAAGTASESYRNDEGYRMIDSVNVPDLYADLYNVCVITPYETQVDKIETDISAVEGSDWLASGLDDSIEVSTATLDPYYIVLIATSASGFKWKSYYAQIETTLNTAATAGATALTVNTEQATLSALQDEIDAGTGAFDVRLQDSSGNDSIISISSISGATLTLTSGIPQTLAEGAEIYILNANENAWSDNNDFTISTTFTEIGGTGTGATGIYLRQTGSTDFTIGDKITIKSNGLILVKTASPQSAYNVTSIGKYGKLEYPGFDNRLFDYRMSKNFSNKIVNEHSNPRWTGTINGVYLFSDVADLIDIYDPQTFVDEKEYRVNTYLRRVMFNLKTMRATLSFRATEDMQR